MIKKILIAGGLFLTTGIGLSATPLTFELRNGSKIEIGSENLEMSIADNSLHATWTGGERDIPVSDISSFYFLATPVGIVSSNTSDSQSVSVFSADGMHIGDFESNEEARYNLQRGLYIIKSNTTTSKIVIK